MQDDILEYLARNPEAEDTLEGIVEWWLLQQRIQSATAEARRALAGLAAQKLVLTRTRADGRVYYRLNRDKHEQIQKQLDVNAQHSNRPQ